MGLRVLGSVGVSRVWWLKYAVVIPFVAVGVANSWPLLNGLVINSAELGNGFV